MGSIRNFHAAVVRFVQSRGEGSAIRRCHWITAAELWPNGDFDPPEAEILPDTERHGADSRLNASSRVKGTRPPCICEFAGS